MWGLISNNMYNDGLFPIVVAFAEHHPISKRRQQNEEIACISTEMASVGPASYCSHHRLDRPRNMSPKMSIDGTGPCLFSDTPRQVLVSVWE